MTLHPTPPATQGYRNSRFLPLAGVRTHVQTWEPDGPAAATVLGLHHFYGSAQTYHRLGPLLARAGIRLVAFDRVGFGLTDRPDPQGRFTGPDAPYTRAFAIRQAIDLLDDLGLDQAVVTGTSMGGAITLELAMRHADRVAHAVPCSAPLTGDASAPARLRPLLRGRLQAETGSRLVRRLAGTIDRARVARSWADPSVVEDVDVEAHARFREGDGWPLGLWWKWVSDEPPALADRLSDLARAGTPVTAVGATHDRLVPARVARHTAEATGGTYVELDCGHVVHAEGAGSLARVLVELVARR